MDAQSLITIMAFAALSLCCGDKNAQGTKQFPRAYCYRHNLYLIYSDGSNYEIKNIKCEALNEKNPD